MSITHHIARLAVVAGLTAVVTTATPAAASQGQIAFVRGGDLHVATVDGQTRQLTSGPAQDAFPAWSPDRRRLAFVRNGSLHVMRADGTAVRRLTVRAGDRYPAWSPDGRRIAFASTRAGGEAEIYVVRRDGRNLRRLTRTPRHVDDTQPVWTADGRSLVFTSNRAGYWNYELFRLRVRDGAIVQRLTSWGTGDDGAPGDDILPDVSRDGSRIAFVSDRHGGYGVWTMATDGSGLRLTFRNAGDNHAFPRFSPDGTRLVIQLFRPDAEDHRILVVPAEGDGMPVLIGRGEMPDW